MNIYIEQNNREINTIIQERKIPENYMTISLNIYEIQKKKQSFPSILLLFIGGLEFFKQHHQQNEIVHNNNIKSNLKINDKST
jgi:hypothetical protein